jgi:hypothetical protein
MIGSCGEEVLQPAWRTPNVLAVARAIRAKKRSRDFPILADALEEAGCDNPAIRLHCEEPLHVRECWLLVSVLAERRGDTGQWRGCWLT